MSTRLQRLAGLQKSGTITRRNGRAREGFGDHRILHTAPYSSDRHGSGTIVGDIPCFGEAMPAHSDETRLPRIRRQILSPSAAASGIGRRLFRRALSAADCPAVPRSRAKAAPRVDIARRARPPVRSVRSAIRGGAFGDDRHYSRDTYRSLLFGDGKGRDSKDQVGYIDNSIARFGRSYTGEPDVIAEELARDEAVRAADTVLLTVPNQLGVEYCARMLETIALHIAPSFGWRSEVPGTSVAEAPALD